MKTSKSKSILARISKWIISKDGRHNLVLEDNYGNLYNLTGYKWDPWFERTIGILEKFFQSLKVLTPCSGRAERFLCRVKAAKNPKYTNITRIVGIDPDSDRSSNINGD